MLKAILIAAAFAAAARAAEAPKPAPETHSPKQEAAEDKARTVPGGASKGVKACHDDVEKFCAAVKPGDGRLGACLKKNEKALSTACRRWTRHGGRGHVDRAFTELDPKPAEEPAKSSGTR